MTRPPTLIYSVDEVPPATILIISALQHVAVMAITLIFPLILARESNMSGTQTLDLVSLSMLGLGVATVCLSLRSHFMGSGYLSPAAYTAIYLGPSLFALRRGGLDLVFGMTITAGVIQLAIAPLLKRLRALLPSEIAGLVIAILGLALASIGVQYSLGIDNGQSIKPDYVIVAGVSLVTMSGLNIWTKSYGKMFCVLIGMVVGYIASFAIGILNFSAIFSGTGAQLFRLPHVAQVGFSFDIYLLAPFAVAALAATLRVMGDISNAQRLNDSDWVRPSFTSLAGGVAANGVAMVFCGLVGSFGINSYSSSIGLSGATGVTSRSVGYVIGAGFAILALFPPAAAVFAAMPRPVMGAALFFTAAFVLTSGMQMITARMLDARKNVVIGFSFAMAVVADVYHNVLTAGMPVALQPIFDNSLVLGTVCAVLLNLITRIGVRQRVSIKLEPGAINREAVEKFLSENGARWAARRDVINRATFGVVQVLEVLGDPPDGVETEASFDEFNLDVRVRYAGAPLEIPENRPTPREIIASENGERLLAGYLLRRSADRISSRQIGDTTEVTLHYDH
jgi:NCS2 family nucleobase:cation symporter-2